MHFHDSVPHPNIIAFDPGLNATGYTCLRYGMKKKGVEVIAAGTITPPYLLKQYNSHKPNSIFTKQYTTLHMLHFAVVDLMQHYEPANVVCEGAFSHRFPQAFASLTLVIHTLRRAVHQTLDIDISMIAPKQAKSHITGSGSADKTQIQDAIRASKAIRFGQHIDVDQLSDHAFDAIGVGCTYLQVQL